MLHQRFLIFYFLEQTSIYHPTVEDIYQFNNNTTLTFPHGESQDGSPGLEAFHKAKSLGDFFSLNRSAEMLRSPAGPHKMQKRTT